MKTILQSSLPQGPEDLILPFLQYDSVSTAWLLSAFSPIGREILYVWVLPSLSWAQNKAAAPGIHQTLQVTPVKEAAPQPNFYTQPDYLPPFPILQVFLSPVSTCLLYASTFFLR